VFAAVEQAALHGLPERPSELASWSSPKVGPDIHARVGKTLYSIPWRLIGCHVDARATPHPGGRQSRGEWALSCADTRPR
jgi:hypothetical protein